MEYFETVWRWRGQRIVIDDLKKYGQEFNTTVTYDAYKRRWGSFKKFIEIFSKYKLEQITFEELQSLKVTKNVREKISPRLRAKIPKRDNYKCVDCGANPKNDNNVKLHIHHITPVSHGGKTEEKNLETNCYRCNLGKSDAVIND